jgi:hypothetical protein
MKRISVLAAALMFAAAALVTPQSADARGRGLGIGIASIIIGSALIAGAYHHNRYYGYHRYHHRHHRHHRYYW